MQKTFNTQPELRLHLLSVTLNLLISMNLHQGSSKGVIPEGEYPKLDFFLIQSLKGLDGGLLFCYIEVVETLRDALLGVKLTTLIVDEGGHLILCCIGVGDDECDEVDHVHAHNSSAGWPAGLTVGVWTVSPVVEGGP
jgi:hypothetical protein